MNIQSLKEMFNNHKHADDDSTNYLIKGTEFPRKIYINKSSSPMIYCFVSLYCKMCIDLLPNLNEFSENFILITDGNQEENIEIQNAFNYTFPIISLDHDAFHDLIKNTPCILKVDTNNFIQELREVNTHEEVSIFVKESR
ncbi:hypothetical protein AB9M62_18900 [Bacillales bacterium AN1005]